MEEKSAATDLFELSALRKAEVLIEALPYIRSLAGKTVVIKYGGNAITDDDLLGKVMSDITLLKYVGINAVLVHGGGPDITAALERAGVKSEFRDGLRVTTSESIDIIREVVIGNTNARIVSELNARGGKGIGLSGYDGSLLVCHKLTRNSKGEAVDLGFVGEVEKVNVELINTLSGLGYIPVIAPIAVDNEGQCYNVNADQVASEVAVALQAEKLMTLTNVPGVKGTDENGEEVVFPVLVETEVEELIAKGTISGGMIPKVRSALETVRRGVGRTHILDGTIPHALLLEIFTHSGIGTMIMQKRRPYHPGERI